MAKEKQWTYKNSISRTKKKYSWLEKKKQKSAKKINYLQKVSPKSWCDMDSPTRMIF